MGIVAVIIFGVLQKKTHNTNSLETVVPERQKTISSPPLPVTNTPPPKASSSSSKNVHTFKSTLNDRERNGQILETSSEPMFHKIDPNNKTVTHSFQIDGIWKEIVYPFSEYYKEEGILHTTMVLKVGDKGVKEIWWTPEVNNLGYDFYNGNRLVSYDLVRVTN